jgi:hypothetical protein
MAWDFNRCVSVLSEEIALLKRIFQVQDAVRQTVMAREWADFDSKIAQINQLGEEFSLLEAERVEIFAALQLNFTQIPANSDQEPSFYCLTTKLPIIESRELSKLYRELKMETLRIKALNETFLNYLKEVKNVAVAWLEAVFPAQGGKLYSRKGRQVSGDPRCMVLNHRM